MSASMRLYEQELRTLSKLSGENFDSVMRALVAAALGDEIPALNETCFAIFELINAQVERDRNLSEKRKNAGKNGGGKNANSKNNAVGVCFKQNEAPTPTPTPTPTPKDKEIKTSCGEIAESAEDLKTEEAKNGTDTQKPPEHKRQHRQVKSLDEAPYDHQAKIAFWENDGVTCYVPDEALNDADPDSVTRLLQELAQEYPQINLVAEFRRARDWLKTAPPGKRPKKSLLKFLRNWVSRARPRILGYETATEFVPAKEG